MFGYFQIYLILILWACPPAGHGQGRGRHTYTYIGGLQAKRDHSFVLQDWELLVGSPSGLQKYFLFKLITIIMKEEMDSEKSVFFTQAFGCSYVLSAHLAGFFEVWEMLEAEMLASLLGLGPKSESLGPGPKSQAPSPSPY